MSIVDVLGLQPAIMKRFLLNCHLGMLDYELNQVNSNVCKYSYSFKKMCVSSTCIL